MSIRSSELSCQPLPYFGGRSDHRPGNRIRRYGNDLSGEISYEFNRLGYRGEEFDPAATKHIFVFGCSCTFGVGLDFEDTWAHRLRLLCAERWGCDASDINLLNFGEGGASNDCISRTLVSQCSAVKPDLVVAMFSFIQRKEYIRGDQAFPMMPWWAAANAKERNDYKSVFGEAASAEQALAEDLLDKARDYYSFYNDETALSDTLRNMLLCQFFCAATKINYMFTMLQTDKLEQETKPLLLPLIRAIDFSRFVPFEAAAIVDKAIDNMHFGVRSSALIANGLFKRLTELGP